MQSLCSLIIQESDLLIVGSASPAAGHDVGYGANVWIVYFVVRRSRYFLFFFLIAGDEAEHAVAAGDDFRGAPIGEQRRGAEARANVGAGEHVRAGFVVAHVIDVHARLQPICFDYRHEGIGRERNDIGAF